MSEILIHSILEFN